MSKRAEEAAMKAYPKEEGKVWASAFGMFEFDKNATERKGFEEGYEQALKDIGIVDELIDQQGIAVIDSLDNHAGYQIINSIRFVGEDKDKPKPQPCRYYRVWLKAIKEEEK